MFSKRYWQCWLIGICACGPTFAAPAPPQRPAEDLRRCIAANFPERSASFDFELRQADADGLLRQLKGQWYWQREGDHQAAVLRLSAPTDLAGMAYLFVGRPSASQEVYVYLPSTRQARRITGATAAQSLFGTGLSAFDLKFLISGLQGGQLSPQGQGKHDGHSVGVWRYQPPADPDILYDRIDLLIDESRCLPLRADLFGGVPWKILSIDAARLEHSQNRWLMHRALLEDLRQNTRTQIQLSNQQFDIELPAELFKPKRFYRTPVQAAARADAAGD